MARTKVKWIIIIVLTSIVLAIGIIYLMKNNNEQRDAKYEQQDDLFESCFCFSLPKGVTIVSSDVKKPEGQGKSIYAFELVFHEEQYEQLRKDLDSYAYKLHEKTEYRSSDNPWKKEEGDFFDDAFDLGRWSRDIWKEQNPSVILFYASTYNDVGYDTDKRIHRTYIMFSKEQDGLVRMYAFTT